MTDPRLPDSNEESKRILGRVAAEDGSIFESAARKASSHFAGKDAEAEGLGDDWAEVWGRRIGRTLGAIFFIVLVVNLFTRWFF